MKKILTFALVALLCLAGASAQNPVWHPLSDQTFNQRAQVILNHANDLYVGGLFTTPEPSWVKFGEAIFDGQFDTPFPVWTAVTFNNEIYIGGDAAPYFAKWSGSNWEFPISGIDGPIYSIYEWGEKLYIGGSFSSFDSRATQNLISFNGELADTVGNGVSGEVYAMDTFQNMLYIPQHGGEIALWNGVKFLPLIQPLSVYIYGCVGGSDGIYFAGVLDDSQDTLNTTKHMVVKYDGSSWKTIATSPNGDFYTLRIINNSLYIGGGFESIDGYENTFNNIAKCVGDSVLEPIGEGVGGYVRDISVYQGNLVVAGWFALSDNDPLNIGVLMYSVVTGINDPEATDAFHVFPNPATSQITISNLQRGKVVTVASLSGQTICSFIASNSQATLDVSSFSSGVYFVKVGTSPQMMKFIVQK